MEHSDALSEEAGGGTTTDPRSEPAIGRIDEFEAPTAPTGLAKVDVDPDVLVGLTLKLASTVPHLSSDWAAQRLCLTLQLTEEIFWKLKDDRLVEILGQEGPLSYRYAITQKGLGQASRLFEISGYVGPAPVSLKSYSEMLQWHAQRQEQITLQQVKKATGALVLPKTSVETAALAISSGRSLFLFGPAGNGKTHLGHLLHDVYVDDLWIPHSLAIDNSIVRIYDPESHELYEPERKTLRSYDRRWIRVKRPFIVAGGEMTINELDLDYSPTLRYYEAPPHLKANGGTFMIDDLGRQKVEPQDLLNRWIIPLEHSIDHLTLHTGQKIQVPFCMMLIVATNLTVSQVADPAFLRRMGYRLLLDHPTPEDYRLIFERYAAGLGVTPEPGLIDHVLTRYEADGRELRGAEPRDLIERSRDVCRLRDQPLVLNRDVIDTAWRGYFGNWSSQDGKS